MDVFTYNDYRKLLKDYYNREKERLPNKFSYRYFSKKCGFLSPNFIHYVITGRRNLSYKSIQKIGRAMELAPRVIQFLETLVHYNQTKDPEEKAEAFEKMISFQEFRDAQKLSQEQYDFYSKWYYPIIRELVNLKNFSEDPSWICKRLYSEISPVEAQQAIENLEKLGLLARDADGKLHQAYPHIGTTDEAQSSALFQFHQKMIEHGKRSLKKSSKQRDVTSLTMSLNEDQYHFIKKKVREVYQDIQKHISKGDGKKPTSVYQMNVQIFDFLKPLGEKL